MLIRSLILSNVTLAIIAVACLFTASGASAGQSTGRPKTPPYLAVTIQPNCAPDGRVRRMQRSHQVLEVVRGRAAHSQAPRTLPFAMEGNERFWIIDGEVFYYGDRIGTIDQSKVNCKRTQQEMAIQLDPGAQVDLIEEPLEDCVTREANVWWLDTEYTRKGLRSLRVRFASGKHDLRINVLSDIWYTSQSACTRARHEIVETEVVDAPASRY